MVNANGEVLQGSMELWQRREWWKLGGVEIWKCGIALRIGFCLTMIRSSGKDVKINMETNAFRLGLKT